MRTVDCSGPNDGLVVSVSDVDGASYPGDEAMSRRVADECPNEASLFFYPTEVSWNARGDREVACVSLSDSTAVQVGDSVYTLDYFARRLRMFVGDIDSQGAIEATRAAPAVAVRIIEDDVVRRFAGELDVVATDEEVREEIASRLGLDAADEAFDLAFKVELARSDLSEAEYLDLIEAAVLTDELKERFLADVPESTEAVRYRQIVTADDGTAEEIRDELESGGDFAALAARHSLDPRAKDTGGEVGWVRRGALEASVEESLFDLDAGEIAIIPFHDGVLVVEMLAKSRNRPVGEDEKGGLADRAFAGWVNEKKRALVIVDNVSAGDDLNKIQWAIGQITGGGR